ncbi:energy transducer TonB [Hallella colorans]|uniref:Protein TonB n=1 Tax=Hallella colorans TaxID=1703337 RepID=A0A2U0U4N7_9BACT|nr:energy transducer TonB [Hallella colorans]PVX51657.1 protein TonB [Hallella colorans]
METKKVESADLERYRVGGFLLGLIVALALTLAGLEFSTRPANYDDADNMLDNLAEDMELLPAMNTHDMISAAPAPARKAITENVKETSTPVETMPNVSASTPLAVDGDGSGAIGEAEVTQALPQTDVDNGDDVSRVVEQLPEFPGGMVEFMKWLTRNLRYPSAAQQQKIEGRVVVTFIVNKDGTIANPKVDKPVNPLIDGEALRVIKMMPAWKPGRNGNKPCRTMVAIPINFKL